VGLWLCADLNAIGDGLVDDVFSYITLQHLPDRAAVLRYIKDTGRVLRPGGRGALQVRHPGLLPWAIDLVGHLAHAAQGHRVWSTAWRGTRVSAQALLAAAERSGVGAELRSRGRRHLWVLAVEHEVVRRSSIGFTTAERHPPANIQDPVGGCEAVWPRASACRRRSSRPTNACSPQPPPSTVG
jgi:hypothetical protein